MTNINCLTHMLFAKRQQKVSSFPLAEAFASGVFLGAGLMHMLPDSSEMFREAGYGYPLAALIAGLMLLFLLWFGDSVPSILLPSIK